MGEPGQDKLNETWTRRDYLVKDEEVGERLNGMRMPPGSRRDRVVLLLTNWFDRVLWNELCDIAERHGTLIENVSFFDAAYVVKGTGYYLMVESFTTRGRWTR